MPYVPAAGRFYLPQWVAFDDAGKLLVNTVSEAEAYLASMQRFMTILHTAVALAPYMVASETYQQKRYGMLGQLINQGMTGVHDLYNSGPFAVLNAVGYDNPNRSHFRSLDIWQSASDADKYIQSGWIGRWLDANNSSATINRISLWKLMMR